MAKKDYKYEHSLGIDGAKERLEPELRRVSEKYGLSMEAKGNTYTMKRSGVDVSIQVNEKDISATIELSWILEKTLRSQIEDALSKKIKGIIG